MIINTPNTPKETITLKEAIQVIKDNYYRDYVIRLNEKEKLVLSELDLVEDVLDGFNDIAFIEG